MAVWSQVTLRSAAQVSLNGSVWTRSSLTLAQASPHHLHQHLRCPLKGVRTSETRAVQIKQVCLFQTGLLDQVYEILMETLNVDHQRVQRPDVSICFLLPWRWLFLR